MKRKIMITAFMMLLLSGSSYIVKKHVNQSEFSDLELANIEALASGETSSKSSFCWTQFTGGLAWPRQCPSCVRLPFSTGVGTAKTCMP